MWQFLDTRAITAAIDFLKTHTYPNVDPVLRTETSGSMVNSRSYWLRTVASVALSLPPNQAGASVVSPS